MSTSSTTHSAQGGFLKMNFKEMISTVSAETGIPAAQVRKVGSAILEKFAGLVETQDKFISPIITLLPRTIPSKQREDGRHVAERKIARMSVRVKSPAKDL